ncbi:MAG TPA: nucleotidyltransferase domain-containing protein [Geminicoccaceae bacterium]|nr:nucleotidyltransferase domain-containing protein [Geminicoccaceae bacterium]
MRTGPLAGPAERDRLLRELRRLEPELRRRGVRRLWLFGSVARGEADADSDVDLLAKIDRSSVAGFSLLDLIGLQHAIGDEVGGRPAQIVTALHKLHPLVRADMEAIEVFGAPPPP